MSVNRVASLILVNLLALCVIGPLLAHEVLADRCVLPIKDVDVYGPGQKAIVTWNGDIERLILSTDLQAHRETKVLEVLPLPSHPTIEKASFESFRVIQSLMMRNMPRAIVTTYKGGLEVVFHEKIGSHDLTVVKATSITELAGFMSDYLEKNGLGRALTTADEAKRILGDYLTRGFNYWVFDLVDIHPATRSIEPLAYQFKSPSLYYPMKVSSISKGDTEITLYLITLDRVTESDIPSKMRLGRYVPSEYVVQFPLSVKDLEGIDPELKRLFSDQAWLAVAKYFGPLAGLDFDLQIVPGARKCRAISVRIDKRTCRTGETVTADIEFIHLLPGCVEIMVVHFHEARLEIFDSGGFRVQVWQWRTSGNLRQQVLWKPLVEDNYVIRASSWWNGERLEVEDRASVTVIGWIPPIEVQWLLSGVFIAALCIAIGASVAYFVLRPQLAKQS